MLAKGKTIDIAHSYSPFITIFNTAGTIIASNAILNDSTTVPPSGVFAYALANRQDRVTWQPQRNVRIATVILPFHGTQSGFVLVGRNLAEIEHRSRELLKLTCVVWLTVLITSGSLMWLTRIENNATS
jgi:hypothetical protein